jgi:sulfur carrier protein ThiS
MRQYLYDQDAIESLTVVLNGRVLSKDEARTAKLQGEDVLELLSPIGGG